MKQDRSSRSLSSLPVKEFARLLAGRTPCPGGGCASALTAAQGIALVNMVIAFTLGKPAFARYEKQLRKISQKNAGRQRRCIELIDADAAAYRSGNINKAMAVPLEICRTCLEAAADCPGLSARTNRRLASDLAAGVLLLESGFTSACCSVEANLAQSQDGPGKTSIRRKLAAQRKKIGRIRAKVEAEVGRTLRR